jgi:signal transduction histidine kinase
MSSDEIADRTHAATALRPERRDELVARLTDAATVLARRNAALEDFAALVAHELKAPLHAALAADDPMAPIEQALELVDSLLDAARREAVDTTLASPAAVLDDVLREIELFGVRLTTDLVEAFPLPAYTLRVILRNLIRNAVAAGAGAIHVAASRPFGRWTLRVDDDGVGVGDTERYAAGSGLGLALSQRMVSRFGGVLELSPRSMGGTRAIVQLEEAA